MSVGEVRLTEAERLALNGPLVAMLVVNDGVPPMVYETVERLIADRLAAAPDPSEAGVVAHCPTCVCGCTCGFGGQHDPANPRCDLRAVLDEHEGDR